VHKHDVTAASCPNGWRQYKGSRFYVSTTEANQSTARIICQAMGGDLASISDQAEYRFVKNIS